ncbi:MAG: hypothetical protein JKY54_05115 [Flavobacteriales bacterium]|nr:hypothetical protein [Flavobacteriales bacterium]
MKKLTLISLLFPSILFAQFDTIVVPTAEYIHEIKMDNGTFSGPGWDSVEQYYLDHQLFGLGEIHGTLEVPSFFRQLLQSKKVDHYITELDSLSLSLLERDLSFSNLILQDYPGCYAMYAYKEERYLLTDLLENETKIHGIDEVHPISICLHLSELLKDKRIGEKSRKKLENYVSFYNDAVFEGSIGNLNSRKTRDKVKKLLLKIKAKELEGKAPLVDFIVKNWNYYSMKKRSLKMKIASEQLFSQLDLSKNSNLVFKFGGSHISRVKNTAGYFDVGFAMDSATHGGQVRSYHLLTVIVEGDLALPATIGKISTKPFDIRNDPFSAHLIPFGEVFNGEQCLFFDLKGFSKTLESKDSILSVTFAKMLASYDGLVLFRNGTPSPVVIKD